MASAGSTIGLELIPMDQGAKPSEADDVLCYNIDFTMHLIRFA